MPKSHLDNAPQTAAVKRTLDGHMASTTYFRSVREDDESLLDHSNPHTESDPVMPNRDFD